MGLFKHNWGRNQARRVNPSDSETTSICRRLRSLFSKKRRLESGNNSIRGESSGDGSVNPILSSRPPSSHEEPPAIQSLWDRAYSALGKEKPRLVEEYEKLLSKEAHRTSSASNDEHSAQAMPPDDVSRGTDRRSQQTQLDTIIAKGLQRIEEKKKKCDIAGHEFVLRDQIAQAAELVLWAKDWIGVAVKQSPEASIAWAGVCMILPLLTNPVAADEANRDGFLYVTTRMRYYTELEPLVQQLGKNPDVSHALMAEVNGHVVSLYQGILEFQILSVLRFYEKSLKRYVGDVLQTGDWEKRRISIENLEKTVNGDLSRINQFTSRGKLESLDATSIDALKAIQQLLSVSEQQLRVAEVHRDIAERQFEMQKDEVKQKLSDKQKKCLQLFRLTSGEKDATYEWYKDRVEDRVDGTCEWFLNHDNFRRWLEQASGPLLVSADPGCGKSVLAKYLIDHGLPRSPTTICYFFFKDQDQNTVRQALCALLHQLLSLKPSLIKHATEQFDKDGEGLINSTRSLWNVLENAVKDPQAGPVIMVLDALDECIESEFEDLMRNLENQSNHGKLKYLLTSRPYEQIVSKFQRLMDTFPYVRIPGEEESETISQEVNHVIKYRVEKLAKEKRLSDKIKGRLTERLLGISHRTYLWVYLVFDYLETERFKMTEKGIDSTISTMPKTIYQAYEQILNKSKEDPMVRMALSIVLVASRPLTISEMNVALNTNTASSIQDLDLEEDEDFKLRLTSWCGLFLSIYHGKVYFLHQTAREFLLDLPSPATIPPEVRWQHSIASRDAHKVLAEICVVYLDFLNSDDISNDIPIDERGKISGIDSYTFLDYSANNWGDHFREACFSDDAGIVPSTLRICGPDSKSYSIWLKLARDIPRGTPDNLTNLLISSYYGHEVVVMLLLKNGADLESKDSDNRTPLLWAARHGYEGIVNLLLKNGADLESKDKHNQTPLSWAAENGYEGIVNLLLKNGADLKSKDNGGRTPLSWAAENGYKGVVKLLESGAAVAEID